MACPGHHDKALTEHREAQAVELAAQGCGYDEIAREVGYANRGTAHRTVMRALRQHTADAVEDLREAELERLDELQRALWDRAMNGDPRAVQAVLRIVAQRCRLLGLEQDRETQGLGQVIVPNTGWEERLPAWLPSRGTHSPSPPDEPCFGGIELHPS